MNDDGACLIDPGRTAFLCEVGGRGFLAATAVRPDGTSHLVIACLGVLGDADTKYDSGCAHVEHEGIGPLPLEYIRRLTISRRRQRSEGSQ
jgi:hypothetical protein